MLELPKPPWYRRVWTLYLAIAVVVVLVAATMAFGARGEQAAGPTTPTGGASVTPEGSGPDPTPTLTDTTPPSRTSARPQLGVLWQKSGSDVHHGSPFEAPGSWRLLWSFDCRNFAGHGGGNFKVTGEGDFDAVSVQEFGVKGKGSRPVVAGGRGRLVVESVCDRWTVKAVAA